MLQRWRQNMHGNRHRAVWTWILGALLAHGWAWPAAAEDWPRWRGNNGSGVSEESPLPLNWSAGANIEWKTVLEGEGYSSPIVANRRVFASASLDLGARRLLHCLDRVTGELLWTQFLDDDDPEVASSMTGHAAATPASDGERVVAAFGRAGLICYDFQGVERWRLDLGEFESELGLASSPIIDQGRVFLICDHDGDRFTSFDSYLIAVAIDDGQILWKTPRRGLYRSWSTPILAVVDGRRELIVNAQDELRAYDPESGQLLWQAGGMTGWVAPSPVLGNGLIFAASGKNGPILAVRPGGAGDVTATHVAWRHENAGARICSPVLYGDYLYAHDEAGRLTCMEAATGKVEYRRRLAGKFAASGVAGDGRLYFVDEEGATHVIRAGPAFELLAVNRLDEYTLASPAISGRRIFIRTQQHLYCVAPETEPAP